MRRIPSAGLCKRILPNAVGSRLVNSNLPYNWSNKLHQTVLGIALARSLVLQDIARTMDKHIKRAENLLSKFLNQEQLDLNPVHRAFVIGQLRRLGTRRLHKFKGKVVLIIDGTGYAKPRSRGKKRHMPRIGTVKLNNQPGGNKSFVSGYQEIHTALLLKGRRSAISITRRLHSEKAEGFISQNTIEESDIRKAQDLVKEALGAEVIVVADRGFRRKQLLHRFVRMEKTDFVIRIEAKLKVVVGKRVGLISNIVRFKPERVRTFWRESDKHSLFSAVRAFRAMLSVSGEKDFAIRILHLTTLNRSLDPMVLATSLPITCRQDLREIVALYSARWAIETFFFSFKQSFGAHKFRVFSSWKAIDRLLAMAHMAFLALAVAYELMRNMQDRKRRRLWRQAQTLLRLNCARPPELTLGKFFEIIALDFLRIRFAGGFR